MTEATLTANQLNRPLPYYICNSRNSDHIAAHKIWLFNRHATRPCARCQELKLDCWINPEYTRCAGCAANRINGAHCGAVGTKTPWLLYDTKSDPSVIVDPFAGNGADLSGTTQPQAAPQDFTGNIGLSSAVEHSRPPVVPDRLLPDYIIKAKLDPRREGAVKIWNQNELSKHPCKLCLDNKVDCWVSDKYTRCARCVAFYERAYDCRAQGVKHLSGPVLESGDEEREMPQYIQKTSVQGRVQAITIWQENRLSSKPCRDCKKAGEDCWVKSEYTRCARCTIRKTRSDQCGAEGIKRFPWNPQSSVSEEDDVCEEVQRPLRSKRKAAVGDDESDNPDLVPSHASPASKRPKRRTTRGKDKADISEHERNILRADKTPGNTRVVQSITVDTASAEDSRPSAPLSDGSQFIIVIDDALDDIARVASTRVDRRGSAGSTKIKQEDPVTESIDQVEVDLTTSASPAPEPAAEILHISPRMTISSLERSHDTERDSSFKTIAQHEASLNVSALEARAGGTQTALPYRASLDPIFGRPEPETQKFHASLAGVADLKARMDHFESKSEELTNAITQAGELESRMDRYAAKTIDLGSTLKRLEVTFDNFVEVDELADLLKARDVRIRGLEADLKRHKTRSQLLEANIEQYKNRSQMLEADVKQYKSRSQMLETRTQNLEQRLAALEVAAASKPKKQAVNSEYGVGYEAW